MKVGDKKQAIILCVVAVAAIGFLITQLGGTLKGNPVPKLLAAMTGSTEPEHKVASAYPEVLTRDAFSHPKLETVPPKPPADIPHGDRVESNAGGEREPSSVFNPVPTDPSWFKTTADGGKVPAEITGPAEKDNVASGVSVKLLATMRASKWMALVQVGSGDSVEVAQGQTVAEGIRVTKIGEEGVSIRRAGKTFMLLVGAEAKL